jgi:preprotein translocase subunit SecF
MVKRLLTGRGARARLGRSIAESLQNVGLKEVSMRNVVTAVVAALSLMGVSGLAVAADATKGEVDQMKADIRADKEAMKADLKAKKAEMKQLKKEHKEKIRAKKREMRNKAKAHNDDVKPQGDAMKAPVQDPAVSGETVKPPVPDIPAPSAPGAR